MVLLDQVKGRHVAQLCVLRRLEVVQDRPAGDDRKRLLLHAEALERAGAEVSLQTIPAVVDREDPVLQRIVVPLLPHRGGHGGLTTPLDQDLLGTKGGHRLGHILLDPLCGAKLARREVEECRSGATTLHHDGTEEVIRPRIQHRVLHRQSRCHQLRHIPLDERLRQLRVLDLVADGDPLPLRDQLRQVDVECMVGEAGEGHVSGTAIGSLREGNPEQLGGGHGIVGEGLIEVPDTEE